jgi:hypothetical protein
MTHLKIVNASRGSIQKYECLKKKLYNCIANIYFNSQCLKRHITPSYANIKVPNTSPAHKHTQKKLPSIRIKNEIKYLHSKKQQSTNIPLTHSPIQHVEQHMALHPAHNRGEAPQWNEIQIQVPRQQTT